MTGGHSQFSKRETRSLATKVPHIKPLTSQNIHSLLAPLYSEGAGPLGFEEPLQGHPGTHSKIPMLKSPRWISIKKGSRGE